MIKLTLFCVVVSCGVFTVTSNSDSGPGLWKVNYVKICDNSDVMEMEIDQHRINRTHDGFTGRFNFKEALTHAYGIRVEISKRVDGGYKLNHVLSEPDFIDFVKKYAGDNVEFLLTLAGVDPPDFPIDAGDYKFEDFIMDYSQLPSDMPYGEYSGKLIMLQGDREMFSAEGFVEFYECNDNDDDDDE